MLSFKYFTAHLAQFRLRSGSVQCCACLMRLCLWSLQQLMSSRFPLFVRSSSGAFPFCFRRSIWCCLRPFYLSVTSSIIAAVSYLRIVSQFLFNKVFSASVSVQSFLSNVRLAMFVASAQH